MGPSAQRGGAGVVLAVLLLGASDALQASSRARRRAAVVVAKNESVDYFGNPTSGLIVVDEEEAAAEVEQAWPFDQTNKAPAAEQVFCSRSLNLRSIRAVGYDMDYTVVQYNWAEWEELAYECTKEELANYGFPVADLAFSDPDLICRGLVLDRDLGNFVKIDRHGFVRRAMHGARRLGDDEVDAAYGRSLVDLRESRYSFLNTLFSVSEGVLYAQLVQKLDSGALIREASPPFDASRVSTYVDLHRAVSKALSRAHNVNSRLKKTIAANPARYTQREPDKLRQTFADQRAAGQRLALITNSDWAYTDTMMRFVLDDDPDWRSAFDVVICSARKPQFFTPERLPCYELVFDDNKGALEAAAADPLLRATDRMECGKVYVGGSARHVERLFGVAADRLLYVGDHIFTDANMAKVAMRWRTALVVQELEAEIGAVARERAAKKTIDALLLQKDLLVSKLNTLLCELRRYETALDAKTHHRVKSSAFIHDAKTKDRALLDIAHIEQQIQDLDSEVAPAIRRHGAEFNKYWGYITRAAYNDKSHLARQIEKYADIYCARVTNLLFYTPYHYFRNAPQSLAHERPFDDD